MARPGRVMVVVEAVGMSIEVPSGSADRLAADFPTFFAQATPRLVRLGYALTGSSAEAEELVQETMVRCYLRWARVGRLESPDAWCRRVLLNLIYSRTRRLRSERAARRRDPTPETTAASDLPVAAAHFWALVRSLPPRQAEVIALRYVEGLDVAGIAAALGRAEGTIRAQLYTGRQALAARIDENGEMR
jgi:RNA polymerase sigma-70 factor (ECF subfamily)